MKLTLAGISIFIVAVVSLFSAACFRSPALYALALASLVLLYGDYVSLRRLAEMLALVSVRRRVSTETPEELSEVEVELEVVNGGPAYSPRIDIEDTPPSHTVVVRGSSRGLHILRPHSSLAMRYVLRPLLPGRVAFGPVRIVMYSPLKLFAELRIYSVRQWIVVVPRTPRLEALEKALSTFVGVRLVGRTTGGLYDLVMIREYAPGDDIRRILWKHLARTGRLLVREDRGEVQGKVLVIPLLSTDDWRRGEVPNTSASILLRALQGVLDEIRRSYGVVDVVVPDATSAHFVRGVGRGRLRGLVELYASITPFGGAASPADVVLRTVELVGLPSAGYGLTVFLTTTATAVAEREALQELVTRASRGAPVLVAISEGEPPREFLELARMLDRIGCQVVAVEGRRLVIGA